MATTLKLPNSLNRSHKDGVNNAILSHLSRFNTLISSFIILSPYPLPTPKLLPSFYLPNFPSLPFLAPLTLPLETFFISHAYHTSPCYNVSFIIFFTSFVLFTIISQIKIQHLVHSVYSIFMYVFIETLTAIKNYSILKIYTFPSC